MTLFNDAFKSSLAKEGLTLGQNGQSLRNSTQGKSDQVATAITSHLDRLYPDNKSGPILFAESMIQTKNIIDTINSYRLTNTDTRDDFVKIAGRFAQLIDMESEISITDQFRLIGNNLLSLGKIPAQEEDRALLIVNELSDEITFPIIESDDDAIQSLENVKNGRDLDIIKRIMETPNAILTNGADILDIVKSSGNTITDDVISVFNDVLSNIDYLSDIGRIIVNLSYDGPTTYDKSDSIFDDVFPLGSGENNTLLLIDVFSIILNDETSSNVEEYYNSEDTNRKNELQTIILEAIDDEQQIWNDLHISNLADSDVEPQNLVSLQSFMDQVHIFDDSIDILLSGAPLALKQAKQFREAEERLGMMF